MFLINVQLFHWLILLDKPEGTILTTSAADNAVTQGGSVTFTCHVTAAKPQVSRYRFYLNDTTQVKDSNDSQYTINNVQRSQHFGEYKCVPRNDVGDGPEAAVMLNVKSEYHRNRELRFLWVQFFVINSPLRVTWHMVQSFQFLISEQPPYIDNKFKQFMRIADFPLLCNTACKR